MTSGGGGGGGTPYIGSKISLISKAEIRYEGILYDVNTKDSTVTLSKVRSHGTEGRPAVKPVQPRSEVYEYIIFRGSDIKDLSVNEVAKSSEEPQDPAILSTHSSPPVSSQTQAPPTAPPTTVPASVPPLTTVPNPPGLPLQAPPTHHSIPPIYNNPFSLGAMGAGSSYNPFPYLGRPPFLLNQPGGGVMGGSKPVPVPQRISSSTPANQATPPNSESVLIIAATTQSKAGPVAEGTPPNTLSASSINTSTPNTGSTISPLQNSISASDSSWSRPSVSEGVALPPDPAITDSSHDNEDTEEPSEQTAPHTGGAGGGGGGGGRKARQFKERGGGSAGRGGPHRQPRPHSGGPKTSSESAPPNGVVAKKPLRYDSDFDFDIANALFSKETIEKEIKEKLKITTGDRPQATGDEAATPLRWEGPGEEVGGASEGLLQEEEDSVQSYDKEVSFFDNISCEANTSNKKYNRSEERALNTETFGITSRGPPRGGRARGGRGQRGRGYSRGGSRPDRTYRHDDGYGQQRDGHYRNRGGSYRGRGRNDYYGDSYGRNDYHGDGYRGRGDPHGDSYRGRGDPHGDGYRGRGDPHGDSYRGRGDPHGDGYRGRGDPQGDGYRGRDNYHGDGYRGRGGYHGNDNRGRKDHYGNAYHRSDYPRSREY